MLTSLHLRNFKSWRDTGHLRLAPITAFFGANSSGKTSLLQSLLMMRQTMESPDRSRVFELGGASAFVELGTYSDILFGHSNTQPLYLGLGWESPEAIRVVDPVARARKVSSTLISSNKLGLEAEVDIDDNDAQVRLVRYSLGDATFEMERRSDGKGYDLYSDKFTFVRTTGRAWPLPTPSKFYGFPDQVRLYYQNASFLSVLELEAERVCSRIRYLGPLRDDPKRQYIHSGGKPSDLGRRGELAVEALVAAQVSGRKVSRGWQRGTRQRKLPGIPIEQLVAEWLKELGLIESFRLEALDDRKTVYRVSVQKSAASSSVLLTDVGFGVSQVLPVLVLLANAEQGDTVILEQPEIHLHPAVQSGLADVIVETVLARGVQVIVESHSEHLVTRLQRRLAEESVGNGLKLTPEDVALYFCSQARGESRIDQLQIDIFGSISNWPEDFFGNPLADSVATLEAAARRVDGPVR